MVVRVSDLYQNLNFDSENFRSISMGEGGEVKYSETITFFKFRRLSD